MKFSFFLALAAYFLAPTLFPSVRLFAFAPLLALILMKKERIPALWLCAAAGLLIDLTSSGAHFGLYCLSYTIIAFIAYMWRHYFYEESLFSLPMYTLLLSLLWSTLFFLFGKYRLHPQAFLTNFLVLPLLDAVYAFFWFTCPLLVYNRIKKRPKRYT